MDSIIDSMDTSLSKLWDVVKDREAWGGGSQRFRHDLATEQQQQKARAETLGNLTIYLVN